MTSDMKRLEDKLDHALLLARQSTPDSLSPILQEIRNKINSHGEKLDNHIRMHEVDVKDIKNDISVLKTSVEPAVSAIDTANNLKKGVTWLAALIIACGVVFAAFKELKKF